MLQAPDPVATQPVPERGHGAAAASFARVLLFIELLVLVCGAVYLIVATPQLVAGYDPAAPLQESAATMPRLGLGVVVLGCLWELLRLFRGARLGETDEYDLMDSSPRRCLTALVAMLLYVVGIWAFGYLPASIVFVWLMAWSAGIPLRPRIALALLLPGILYALFIVLLHVAVPAGILFH